MLGAIISAASSLFGAGKQQKTLEENARRQEELQREFAQKGIQWKAADAEAAGISKLYALGANTHSYSPVSVGSGGNGIAEAGQSIGRAIDATASPTGRVGHLQQELAQTQLEGAKLDNEIKRANFLSTMAQRNQPGNPPAYMNPNDTTHLLPGQGNSEAIALTPKLELERKLQLSRANQPHASAGVNPEVDYYRTSQGYAPMIPQQLGEALESQPLGAAQWMMRNQIMPAWSDVRKSLPYMAPEGRHWVFNPVLGEYTLQRVPMGWRDLIDGLKGRRSYR